MKTVSSSTLPSGIFSIIMHVNCACATFEIYNHWHILWIYRWQYQNCFLCWFSGSRRSDWRGWYWLGCKFIAFIEVTRTSRIAIHLKLVIICHYRRTSTFLNSVIQDGEDVDVLRSLDRKRYLPRRDNHQFSVWIVQRTQFRMIHHSCNYRCSVLDFDHWYPSNCSNFRFG